MSTGTLGRRLAWYRQQRHWSQRELERVAGLPHTTVLRIERGKHEPSAAVVHRLARALGIAVCQLYPPIEEEELAHA